MLMKREGPVNNANNLQDVTKTNVVFVARRHWLLIHGTQPYTGGLYFRARGAEHLGTAMQVSVVNGD